MPRITPLRVISLLPLAWVSIITTWLVLPSPGYSHATHNAYVDSALRQGHIVTTAISSEGRHKGLLIDWKLERDAQTESVLLRIGGSDRFNLTDIALRGHNFLNDPNHGSGTDGPHLVYVGELCEAHVRAGEEHDNWVMPWFSWADQLLINYQFRHQHDTLSFRLLVASEGVVQVWPDLATFYRGLTGLADITNNNLAKEVLATFSDIPLNASPGVLGRGSPAVVRTTHLSGQLPSRTWPIRYVIAQPLYAPTFLPIIMLRMFITDPVFLSILIPVYLLTVFIKWRRAGRPPLTGWTVQLLRSVLCCSTQARKARGRGIWGPSGPVVDEESGSLRKTQTTTFSAPLNTVFKPSKSRPRIFDRA